MLRQLSSVLLAGCLFALGAAVQAAPITTWYLKGVVTTESGTPLMVGDEVDITLVFDSGDTAEAGATTTNAIYLGAIQSFLLSGTGFTGSLTAGEANLNRIEIQDGPLQDLFSAELRDTINPLEYFSLQFVKTSSSSDPTCIEGVGLPTATYNLACFGSTMLLYTDFATFKIIAQDIETQVPEPATLALLGLGLAGIAFSRRRRR